MIGCNRRAFIAWAVSGLSPLWAAEAPGGQAAGRVLRAEPGDYRSKLGALRPGDTLLLAPGQYTRGLPLHGLVGAPAQPIVITGPKPPARAVFVGRPGAHTVSLLDSAHVILRDLVLDGRGAGVDGVRAEGHAQWAHHITLERLTIVNHGASQQNSAISTKCPAWGWIVRGNTIVGAGTGMYFGDSDGSDPFFDSVIDGNTIINPVGYGIQVKQQIGRPTVADAAEAPSVTVIRRNKIIKSRVASTPELARPSLLVGHWPLVGAGASDRYLIYGNLLFDNPSEALFQGEGNLALYNNLFVNPNGVGLRIRPHNHQPREVAVFNNTIVAAALGVQFIGGEPRYERLFEHNLVYGSPPLETEIDGENVAKDYSRATMDFVALSDTDVTRLDLRTRSAGPVPQSSIAGHWRTLPRAREDYVGRTRARDSFGACGSVLELDRACR